MKKKVILIGVALLSMTFFTTPDITARGRNAASVSNGAGRPGSSQSRPSHPGGSQGGQRPGGGQPGGNNHGGGPRPGSGHPGGNNHGGGQRPGGGQPGGNNHGGGQRPGGGHPGGSRPGSGHPGGNHPGGGPRPGTGHLGKPNPPAPPRPGYVPPRPHTPPSYGYYRPTPPPSWRPYGRVPNFGTILGITLGSMLVNSVNSLIASGYTVAGYTNNQVYLSNVSLYNLIWPNVTMYYNNGLLNGSLFSYASSIYDPSRYNYVYNSLMAQYGVPVSTQTLSNGGSTCTWWGYNNNYITLSFYPEYLSNGMLRYFTTVSMGN